MSVNPYAESILNELENNEDGSFQVRNVSGFAMLTVFKAGKNGKPVKTEDVIHRLQLFGIEKFDHVKIDSIVKLGDGKEYKIAEWTGGTPVDAKAELEISEDKMRAFLTIQPPKHGGLMLTKDDLMLLLRNNGICYGVKEEIVDEIIKNSRFFIKTLVAEGKSPIPSTNGYIRTLFDTSLKPKLSEDEFGRVDYRNLNLIRSVKIGDPLAEKVEPSQGEIGKNVYGTELPFEKGLQGEWRVGPNCSLSDDKKKLLATISGRPVLEKDGTIRVDEVCLLENVDYSTGNIDFPGTIIVEGNVADNFTLKTKGSLIIKKSVGRVFLFAEKDIVLSGGVMGRNGGFIEAGNDIYTKFVEQGNLKAGRSILIEEAAMHSELVAGESIIISGGRGELIGGEAIAGSFISLSKLGAVVETRTNVIVGMPPQILDELKKMREDIISKEETLKKVRNSLQKINDSLQSKKELTPEEKDLLRKLLDLEKKYIDIVSKTRAQYESVLNAYDSTDIAYIEVEKFIYPRVSANFGKGKLFNSELRTINGKCYVYVNNDGIAIDSHIPPKNVKKIPEKK